MRAAFATGALAAAFVGAALGEVTLERCRELAALALDCDTAREARAAVMAGGA